MIFDAQFIVVQRYNRPIVTRLIEKKKRNFSCDFYNNTFLINMKNIFFTQFSHKFLFLKNLKDFVSKEYGGIYTQRYGQA